MNGNAISQHLCAESDQNLPHFSKPSLEPGSLVPYLFLTLIFLWRKKTSEVYKTNCIYQCKCQEGQGNQTSCEFKIQWSQQEIHLSEEHLVHFESAETNMDIHKLSNQSVGGTNMMYVAWNIQLVLQQSKLYSKSV